MSDTDIEIAPPDAAPPNDADDEAEAADDAYQQAYDADQNDRRWLLVIAKLIASSCLPIGTYSDREGYAAANDPTNEGLSEPAAAARQAMLEAAYRRAERILTG